MDRDGAPLRADGPLLAVGLEPVDEAQLIQRALVGPGDSEAWLVSAEGEVGLPAELPITHYDMTGACSEPHDHVVWDPTDLDPDRYYLSLTQLMVTAAVENGYRPPPGSEHQMEDGVAPATMPVIAVALRAAAGHPQGVRQAMDSLAGGQLSDLVEYVYSVRDPSPALGTYLGMISTLLKGRKGSGRRGVERAVQDAWRSLAPVEEIVRTAAASQSVRRLDLDEWLRSRRVLVVTMPDEPPIGHQQALLALAAAARWNRPDPQRPKHWAYRDLGKPRFLGSQPSLQLLVCTRHSSHSDSWDEEHEPDVQGRPSPQPYKFPSLLFGAAADQRATAATRRRVGHEVAAPAPGQMLFVTGRYLEPIIPDRGRSALPSHR